MSHDLHASWASTEIASIFRKNPNECFQAPPAADEISVIATREGVRSWPISDGVIHLINQNRESYEIALEFKRSNEGLHGILTAIGQSHAYLHKGFSAALIVIPNTYDSHATPGELVSNILKTNTPNLPIGLYTYDDPDPANPSPFSGRMQCFRHIELDRQSRQAGQPTPSRIETQWGHVREGSDDPDGFLKYLKTAKEISFSKPHQPVVDLPDPLIAACQELGPNRDPINYLSYASNNEFHDYVWRHFWFKYVFHQNAIPIWSQRSGNDYALNQEPTRVRQINWSFKIFFAARKDSIKQELVRKLNANEISEEEAWKEYAKNVHGRAHSYREDIDSSLYALNLLEVDGRPSELGYRFVDACERSCSSDTGIPKAIFVAALLKKANFGTLLHYIFRLSEETFKKSYGNFWCMRNEEAAHPLL